MEAGGGTSAKPMLEPVVRRSCAAHRRAMQMEATLRISPRINHAARDESAANGANALVVERIPFPVQVAFAQRNEFFVEAKTLVSRGPHRFISRFAVELDA